MRIILSAIRQAFYGLLIAFVLVASLSVFLLTSTPGLYVTLKLAGIFLPGQLTVAGLDGRMADHLVINKLSYSDKSMVLELHQLDLRWNLHDLLRKQLTIERLQIAQVRYAGQEFSAIDLQANVTRERFFLTRLHAIFAEHPLALTGDAQLIPSLPLQATLSINNQGKQGKITLTGDLTRYHLYGQLAPVTVKGTLTNGSVFHALVTTSSPFMSINKITIDGQITEHDAAGLEIYSRITTRYNDNTLESILRYSPEAFHASATLGANQVQINGTFPARLTLSARLPNPALLHPSLEGLKTGINASGMLKDLQSGQLTVTVGKGLFELPDAVKIPFEGGQWLADLGSKGLDINSRMTIDKDKLFQLSVKLPHFALVGNDPARQAIRGKITFDINSLAFLKELHPAIGQAQGKLQALLTLTGTLKKTRVEGDLKLLQASLSLPKLGINLNPILLSLHSKDKHWMVKSSLVSNGHPLNISGSGDFAPVVKGLLSINGEMIPIVNTVEYIINASPKLTFELSPSSLKMRGNLLIPKALIKPRTFTETASLSDDVVFVNKASPPPNPYNIDTDIHVLMGDEVVLGVKGLQGFLIGGVRVQQVPKGPLTASGELTIRDGKYRAYGQDLLIEQGQLLFTGGLIENPGIRVRATRQFKSTSNTLAENSQLFNFNSNSAQSLDFGGKITVGIEVNGRLSKPKVQLFSIPSNMSQADILSMLLLGKPASQASQSGGQLLLTAVSALNLDSGTRGVQLLGQLKQKLGIDFNLANNTQYNQKTNQSTDNTAVVIGKSLSKRLYVSYNVGLSQTDSNVLTLNYLLSKFFSIQVNASTTASGIDLLYTHQKE